MQNVATTGEPGYSQQREQFLGRLKAFMSATNDNLCHAQARADFDKAVKLSAETFRPGKFVFLRWEVPTKYRLERTEFALPARGHTWW